MVCVCVCVRVHVFSGRHHVVFARPWCLSANRIYVRLWVTQCSRARVLVSTPYSYVLVGGPCACRTSIELDRGWRACACGSCVVRDRSQRASTSNRSQRASTRQKPASKYVPRTCQRASTSRRSQRASTSLRCSRQETASKYVPPFPHLSPLPLANVFSKCH